MTKEEAVIFLQKLIDSNSDLHQEEREQLAEVIKLLSYNVYAGIVNSREMYDSASALLVYSIEEPTPEQIAKVYNIDYDPEEDAETFIEVEGPQRIRFVNYITKSSFGSCTKCGSSSNCDCWLGKPDSE